MNLSKLNRLKRLAYEQGAFDPTRIAYSIKETVLHGTSPMLAIARLRKWQPQLFRPVAPSPLRGQTSLATTRNRHHVLR
jgi:hypothetical protein